MTHDFLDDEQRKRLAYADRAETLEPKAARHDDGCRAVLGGWACVPSCAAYTQAAIDRCKAEQAALADGTGHHEACLPILGTKLISCVDECGIRQRYVDDEHRRLADGTGRHSRKEMEQARPEATYRPFARPWPCTRCGAAADRDCTYIAGAPMAGDYGPEIHVERLTPEDPTPVVSSAVATVVAGVSFTSVPQLCAAYEYALEMLKRLYLMTDRKQHAWQPEQDAMLEARALLLAAGKDVE